MFVRPKDKNSEFWDGVRTGPDVAIEHFGLDEAYPLSEFQTFVTKFREKSGSTIWFDDKNCDQDNLLPIINDTSSIIPIDNPTKFIHSLRLIKSPTEQDLMRKTCEIASVAINETMGITKPGISEHHLFATVDYKCRMMDASFLAYPPVVASGRNGNTIHYINNCQIAKDGEIVLMDAGCEYGGYSSDITRTWPVNGQFNDYQRVLYEVVLALQKDLLDTINVPGGLTLNDLFDSMCHRLGVYLQEINLLPKDLTGYNLQRAAYKYCPHHVSHYLGMDVHDTPLVSRSNQLCPGMVFTVEPGIYISPEYTEIPKEFHGLGIRIEDDILVKDDMNIEILTSKCVKEINDVERLINKS
jgi:Xaa-Pro aminopeptidase